MDKNDPKQKERADVSSSKGSRRDDTPSFIRDVEARATMLNPQRNSLDALPVLTMPATVRIWRAVRWPLFVVIVIILLLIVGLVTNDLLIARSVEKTIAEAQSAEFAGDINKIDTAGKTLAGLAEHHPDRLNAQAAWAWQAILQAIFLGPETEMMEKASATLKLIPDDDSHTAWAARAGSAYLKGDYEEALKTLKLGLQQYPKEPRLRLIEALALHAKGETTEANSVLDASIDNDQKYVPLAMARVAMEAASDNRLVALGHTETLLALAPGNLYGALMAIRLALPKWAEKGLAPERIVGLRKSTQQLKRAIETAPPKLKALGYYIEGRIALSSGNLGEAIESFSRIADENPDSELLAWRASAIDKKFGPDKALELLNKYPKFVGPEVLDIRVQCLLARYRVSEAKSTLDDLGKTGALKDRFANLSWMLAVRNGDLETAKSAMDDKLRAADRWPALEFYLQLKKMGDAEGIQKLANALNAELPSCAAVIRAWHDRNIGSAFKLMLEADESETARDICVDALAMVLLRSHEKPERLAGMAQKVTPYIGSNLRFQLARALALWPRDGHQATQAVLDRLSQFKIEGKPLLTALARAYLELDLPEKAARLLGKAPQDPELLALRFEAATEMGDSKSTESLWKAVQKEGAKSKHPALVSLIVTRLFTEEKVSDVLEWANPWVPEPTAGRWTAEIAEAAARALSYSGERSEADKLLQKTIRNAVVPSGLDESWKTQVAQIRLNVHRGGKFMFRALYLISEFRGNKVHDPMVSYYFGLIHMDEGNDRVGLRHLFDSIELDPTFKPTYKKLNEMGKLGEEQFAVLKKMRPRFTP